MPTYEIEISYSGTITKTSYFDATDEDEVDELVTEDVLGELPENAVVEITEVRRVHG